MGSLGPERQLSGYWFRALPPETSAFHSMTQGPPFQRPSSHSGRMTVAPHPSPACHNNPPRDKTQNSKSKQASPKKEVRLLHCLSQPHLPPLPHSPRTQPTATPSTSSPGSPPLQPCPPTHTHPQDSHGPLQFFILDGAVQGLGREEQIRVVWVSPGGRCTPFTQVPELGALPLNLGEETELGERAAGRDDPEHRMWSRVLRPRPSSAT